MLSPQLRAKQIQFLGDAIWRFYGSPEGRSVMRKLAGFSRDFEAEVVNTLRGFDTASD